MRPRKVIVLYALSTPVLEEWRFKLETLGFRVLAAKSLQRAREHCIEATVDGVMTFVPGNLAIRLLQDDGRVPVLLADCAEEMAEATAADLFVVRGPEMNIRLLDAVRVLIGRKRGPRTAEGDSGRLRDAKSAALAAMRSNAAARDGASAKLAGKVAA